MQSYYNGKKVLVTGHTGFKGSWLSIWLQQMGADVVGYALDPITERDNFVVSGLTGRMTDIRGDIRDIPRLHKAFTEHQPEVVFHLAAQPLVRESYSSPVETYETNVMGTINVMEAIRMTDSVRSVVLITTDKCYENREQIWGYRETDALGGHDPYSSSKGACEIAIASWRNSFFNSQEYAEHGKAIASARAGNVIGGGDWAADRIIPDCIRAIESNKTIEIRNPGATRPWQHVLEPLSGYLLLAAKMADDPVKYGQAWNFGPQPSGIVPVWQLAEQLIAHYGKGELVDASKPGELHEANLLALDITKAMYQLDWQPKLSIPEMVALTVDWYKAYGQRNSYELCCEQIRQFENSGSKES